MLVHCDNEDYRAIPTIWYTNYYRNPDDTEEVAVFEPYYWIDGLPKNWRTMVYDTDSCYIGPYYFIRCGDLEESP